MSKTKGRTRLGMFHENFFKSSLIGEVAGLFCCCAVGISCANWSSFFLSCCNVHVHVHVHEVIFWHDHENVLIGISKVVGISRLFQSQQ